MERLTTEFWIQAYYQRLRIANLPVYVVKKGDLTAGAVLVKINTLDGSALLHQREMDLSGERRWVLVNAASEVDIDASINRQIGFDPDLWVVEVEDRAGKALLDAPGISD